MIALWSVAVVGGMTGRAAAGLDVDRVTIGGEIRERYEFRNNADFNRTVRDTLSFVGSRIRLHLGYAVTSDIAFFIQMEDSRLFGSETSTVSNEKNLDIHQGYVTVKNVLGPVNLTLGRQELFFGDHRLVGNLGWSNIGRSFDGLRMTYVYVPVRVDLWAAVPKQFGTNVGADPTFSTSNRESQQFYGLYGAVTVDSLVVEPYVLYLRDTGNATEVNGGGALVSPITAPAARGQGRATMGLRFNGRAADESIDYTAEGAYQTGNMDGRGTTPKSAISAYAVALKAGYTAPVAVKPRLGVEYDLASGDDNPADDRFTTFENLFPTNHMHYGYMDYVGWRNMQALRFSMGLKPTAATGVSLDYHLFWLAKAGDNWYAASGQIFRTTPAGNTQKELGEELDLVAYVMVLDKLRLEAGYGHFFPGRYVKANFPAATDASDFIYVQAGVGF
ncbi:MAG: alginate export family protein [Nitrospirae bacterium]|nr:alginate export family protein [Nitrospirota bacterium]